MTRSPWSAASVTAIVSPSNPSTELQEATKEELESRESFRIECARIRSATEGFIGIVSRSGYEPFRTAGIPSTPSSVLVPTATIRSLQNSLDTDQELSLTLSRS